MNAPIQTLIDDNFNKNWPSGEILPNLNEFITIRWTGSIKSPTSELYTFSFEVDDGIRVWFNNVLQLDFWDSCCETRSYQVQLIKDKFYRIKIEYLQKQGPALFQMFWTSASIAKQIIPSFYLFYHEYVSDSPYNIQVISAISFAENCFAYGDGTNKATVGKAASFQIQSVNNLNAFINNPNDLYQILLEGPGLSTDGNISGSAIYDNTLNSGVYNAVYIPQKIGTYKLSITLLGKHIKDSPFTVEVSIGQVNPLGSLITGISFPKSMIAGEQINFVIELYDVFNNKFTSDPSTLPIFLITSYFQNANNFISPIGVPDYTDYNAIPLNYAGTVVSNTNGSFTCYLNILRAGSFTLEISINNQTLTLANNSISVNPTTLDASKCVFKSSLTNLSITSGAQISFDSQCRDIYHNNIKYIISGGLIVSNIKFITTNDADNPDYYETGTITDIASSPGCYQIILNPKKAGTYSSFFTLNSIAMTTFQFTVNPNANPDVANTFVEISDLNIKNDIINNQFMNAGITIPLLIKSIDLNNNLILTDTSSVYNIILEGTNPSTSDSYHAISKQANNAEFFQNILITKSNTYKISALFQSNNINNSPITNIKIVPISVIGFKSNIFLTGIITSFNAGDTNTYSANLFDKYNNEVTIKQNEIVFVSVKKIDFFNSNGETEYSRFDGVYTTGRYYFSVNLNKVKDYSMILGVTNIGGLKALYYSTAEFTFPNNLINSNFHNDNIFYTKIDEQINFDIGFNPILLNPNDNNSVLINSSNYSIIWEGFLKPTESNTYIISVEVKGRVVIEINNTKIINYANYQILKNDTGNSASIYLENIFYYPIKITLIKNFNSENLIKILWQSDNIPVKEIIPSSNLYYTTYSTQTPILLTVSPIITDPNKIRIEGDYRYCIAGNQKTIKIYLYDQYYNLQNHNLDELSASISKLPLADPDTPIIPTITAVSNGIYNLFFTIDLIGDYSFKINLKPQGSLTTYTFDNTNILTDITTVSNVVDITKTLITGDGYTKATAGIQSSFTLALFDTNGNKLTDNSNDVSFTLISGLETATMINVTKQASGDYLCEYKIFDSLQTFDLTIKINQQTASNLQSTITLSPNDPSGSKSTYSNLVSEYRIGSNLVYDLNIFDFYNNPTINKFEIFVILRNERINKKIINYAEQNLSIKNIYHINFLLNKSTNDLITECGNYFLNSYVLMQGVQRLYYKNLILIGEPQNNSVVNSLFYNSISDTSLNLVEYSTIKLSGFIKINYSETFNFFVTNNSGNNIKFTFDNEVIFDTISTGTILNEYTFSKSLVAGKLYSLDGILYISNLLNADIRIEWSSSSIAREIIPNSIYFYEVNLNFYFDNFFI